MGHRQTQLKNVLVKM